MTFFESIRLSIIELDRRLKLIDSKETSPSTDALLSVTFANVPTGFPGRVRFCSNCRKAGEGPGAGTGVAIMYSNGFWRRISDDATISA